jgi:hypothetical protein
MQTVPGKRTTFLFLTASLMLSACGGGGGGTATPTPPPVIVTPFTSWSAVQPGSTVKADGLGQEAIYSYSGSAITDIGTPSVSENYGALLTFNTAPELTRLVLITPTTTKSFDAFAGLDLDSNPGTDFLIATSRNSQGVITSKAVISNPLSQQWDFQSFGVWETGVDTNTGTLGVTSIGAPSPAEAIPRADGATFTGKVVGSYVNSAGQGHTVLADLAVDFDLSGQSLSFSTTNTRISSNGVDFGAEVTSLNLPKADQSNPSLNTLAYVAGTNNFTGTLTTSGELSGNSSGQFYGPNAEELGGVFFLKAGSGVESYRGAYGASRP